MSGMEGTLWKWTNYFSGWQPRWFVLDNGIMSYYKSQDDVNNGCKGSIKMSVCDVNVHQTDHTRLDLIIPGEAHFYVKAATPQERQQWLVALGSCKACLSNGRLGSSSSLGDVSISEDDIKVKRSELRLYCDLLMQQVHSVKSSVTDVQVPDSQKLDEATSLLSATCDTFIKTLDECMVLSNAAAASASALPEVSHPRITDSALPPSPTKPALKKQISKPSMSRQLSQERYLPPPNMSAPKTHMRTPNLDDHGAPRVRAHRNTQRSASESSNPSDPEHGRTRDEMNGAIVPLPHDKGRRPSLEDGSEKVLTFFSNMSTGFCDIKLQEDGGIPVLPFLEACRGSILIFDKLSATAFAPVKMDVAGNIRKIQQKYSTHPIEFRSLQRIIEREIEEKHETESNSATVALLWLKRAVEFIREFLHEVQKGEEDLSVCATNAYSHSLKPFHGWVVRGVFALAVKAVPYRKEFLEHLCVKAEDIEHPNFDKSLREDMEHFISAIDVLTKILNDFYSSKDLDSREQV